MKVLLIKDVYKLGRAGDIKKVADGYGRNYLIPKGYALLATAGAIKQAESIRLRANASREAMNTELSGVAAKVSGTLLVFASKAGETGKLYGSITPQMIADSLNSKLKLKIDRHIVDVQPIRTLGEHKAVIRLTADLVPEIRIIIRREGEALDIPETSPEVTEPEPEPEAKIMDENEPEIATDTV